VARSAVLREVLDHNGARRHVDPEGEGFCGEDDLHERLCEASFDRLAKRRHHTCMVGGDSRFERSQETPVVEYGEVVVGERLDVALGDLPHDPALVGRREAEPVLEAIADGLVAARPREDEVDRRQQTCVLKALDDLGPPGAVRAGTAGVRASGGHVGPCARPARRRPVARQHFVELDRLGVRLPVEKCRQEVYSLGRTIADGE